MNFINNIFKIKHLSLLITLMSITLLHADDVTDTSELQKKPNKKNTEQYTLSQADGSRIVVLSEEKEDGTHYRYDQMQNDYVAPSAFALSATSFIVMSICHFLDCDPTLPPITTEVKNLSDLMIPIGVFSAFGGVCTLILNYYHSDHPFKKIKNTHFVENVNESNDLKNLPTPNKNTLVTVFSPIITEEYYLKNGTRMCPKSGFESKFNDAAVRFEEANKGFQDVFDDL